jgi:hypothetical protein
MDWKLVAAITAPMLALIGVMITQYFVYCGWKATYENNAQIERQKHLYSMNLERHKAELNLIGNQINDLYGPLLSLYNLRNSAFRALLTLHGNGRKHFFDGTKLTADDLQKWRMWRTAVFMPVLLKMEETIIQNGHLIDGNAPASFPELLSHVASYRATIKEWDIVTENDRKNGTMNIDEQHETDDGWFTVVEHVGVDNFPQEIGKDVSGALEHLRKRQAELITAIEVK